MIKRATQDANANVNWPKEVQTMQNAIFQWPDEERMTKYAYNCNFSMITHDRTRYEYIRKLQEEEEEAERSSHVLRHAGRGSSL